MQETRSFDADTGNSFSLRTKEDAEDYRYFPEPDLSPFHLTEDYLAAIQQQLPPLPGALEEKYQQDYGLSPYDARQLTESLELARFFEAVISHHPNYKSAANWLTGPVKNYLNEHTLTISGFPVPPAKLAVLIQLVDQGQLSFGNAAGSVMNALIDNPSATPLELATSMNLLQESDSSSLEQWVMEAIRKMPEKVKEYQKGKKGLIGLFAGEVKNEQGQGRYATGYSTTRRKIKI